MYNRPLLSRFSYLLVMMLGLFLYSCGEKTTERLKAKPIAFGEICDVAIIADDDAWEGKLGDTVDFYYASAYPILPQPEPILDLSHYSVEDLKADGLRKELRTYLLTANLSDASSKATDLVEELLGPERIKRAKEDPSFNNIIIKDHWAKGQMIILQFGRSYDELVRNLKENFPAILKKIRQHQKPRLEATVFLDDNNVKVEREIKDQIGVDMRIPSGYFVAISDSNVVWIRNETPESSTNIMIHKEKYEDASQLTKEHIKEIRNQLGKEYVSTRIEDSFMKINDQDLPMLSNSTKIDNKYALEARGIWEVVNDYMGGPFVTYLIHDPKQNQLIYIDGFIHAPGKDKREYMMYVEHVIETIKIP